MHYNLLSAPPFSNVCVQLLLGNPVKFMSVAVDAFPFLAQHKLRVPFADGAELKLPCAQQYL